jgi:hypothetical protein
MLGISNHLVTSNQHFNMTLMQFLLSFAAHLSVCYDVFEIIKFYNVTLWLMNPHDDGIGHNKNNHNSRTKAIAAIPMAGIVVAAALLSGLSFLNSYYYQPAIAQQNMTDTTTTTSPTTDGAGAQSACAPTQAGGGGANATTMAGNVTTMGTNATSTTAGGGVANQSTSDIRMLIEQACMAAQNNDTQGVLMNLNLALNALRGGNITTTAGDSWRRSSQRRRRRTHRIRRRTRPRGR